MYDKHFEEIIRFTNIYQKLIDCHIVDFITENLWNTCLPEALRLELEKDEPNWDCWVDSENHPTLNNFMKLTKSLSLESCSIEINSNEFANALPNISNWSQCARKGVKAEFMNAKKLHEVETLGNVIGIIAAKSNSLVIDAGAGKAYLSTFLAETCNVPVLAIDSSESCSIGAICRQRKLEKKTSLSSNLVLILMR